MKDADLEVLAAEQAALMPPGTDSWAVEAGVSPAPVVIERMPPDVAKTRFLARFEELKMQCGPGSESRTAA